MNNIQQFQEKKYCVVENAISSELRDFITQYALFDEMQDFSPEKSSGRKVQVPDAHSKYADPAMETMLLTLQDTMEKNTGLKLFPTYSYYRVYRKGDDLKIHSDRSACEISCTLCFNYSYDDTQYQWPIYFEPDAEVVLKPGSLAIYKGCDIKHWRGSLNVGEDDWQVQGFFHYVNADGPFASIKYDGRENIGSLYRPVQRDPNIPNYIEFL